MISSGNYDAIIFGAGIGGLSCAYGLASEGWRCALVEKRKPVDFVWEEDFIDGYGIQLGSVAFSFLDKLAFTARLQERGIKANKVEIYSHYRFKVGGLSLKHLQPYYLFRRDRIIDFLLSKNRLLSRIEYFFDNNLLDHSFEDNLHKITLSDSSKISSPLIIDATGYSTSLLPKLYRTKSLTSCYQSVRAIINFKKFLRFNANLDFEFCNTVRIYLATDCHMVIYPIDNAGNYNIVLLCSEKYFQANGVDDLLFYAIGKFKNKMAKNILQYLLSGAAGAAGAARGVRGGGSVGGAGDNCVAGCSFWRLYDNASGFIFPLRYKGIALVGDSIYPVLPFLAQGASLALGDASVLVNLLTSSSIKESFNGNSFDGNSLDSLLSLYESIRLPVRSGISSSSRFQAKINHGGFALSMCRDVSLFSLSPIIELYYRYLLGRG